MDMTTTPEVSNNIFFSPEDGETTATKTSTVRDSRASARAQRSGPIGSLDQTGTGNYVSSGETVTQEARHIWGAVQPVPVEKNAKTEAKWVQQLGRVASLCRQRFL